MTATNPPPRVMDPDEVDDIAIDLANGRITPGLRYDDLIATVVAANQACANLAAAIVKSWSDDQPGAGRVIFEGSFYELIEEFPRDVDPAHRVRVVAIDPEAGAR